VSPFFCDLNICMKNRTVLWYWYEIDEIEMASELGFDILPGIIIKKQYYDKTKINSNDFNVVLINHFFHESYDRIKEDLSWADLVIHYTTEIVSGPWQEYEDLIFETVNNKNFITICNGLANMPWYPSERVFADAQTFFTRVARFCPITEVKRVQEHRTIMFDALLGKQGARRDKIFKILKQNDLVEKNLVNYYWDMGDTIYRSPLLDMYDNNPIIGSSNPSPAEIPFSHVISKAIYDCSWFSIVSETYSGTTFITEKTAKCLLTGRLFVMFGEMGHLAKLRSYGYKTFAPFVDESYDLIQDEDERIKQAFTQVHNLCRRDDIGEVINEMYPIFKHNQKLLLDNQSRLKNFKNFLLPYLNQKKTLENNTVF